MSGYANEAAESPEPNGFPAVASFIANDPDQETYVFRSFSRMTARTLLHMQSELSVLEREQEQLDEAAAKSEDREVAMMMHSWEGFNRLDNAKKQNFEVVRRIELAEEIEVKLRRYHKALALQSGIARLEPPSERVLDVWKAFFYGAKGDAPRLYEPSQARSLRAEPSDLVALSSAGDGDLLSKSLRNHIPRWLASTAEGGWKSTTQQIRTAEGRRISRLAATCSVIIAAFLLIGSILLLYFVTNADARLALVLVFIVLFATGVSISTSATRDGIFASTAAYAAVLIVFVSGNLGSPNGPS